MTELLLYDEGGKIKTDETICKSLYREFTAIMSKAYEKTQKSYDDMVNTIIQDQDIGGIDFPLIAKHLQVVPFAELLEPELVVKLKLDEDEEEEQKLQEPKARPETPEANFDSFDDSENLRINSTSKQSADYWDKSLASEDTKQNINASQTSEETHNRVEISYASFTSQDEETKAPSSGHKDETCLDDSPEMREQSKVSTKMENTNAT